MKSLQHKNSVYYSYIIVNFLWYALCGAAVLFVVTIFTEHFFGNLLGVFNLNIPVSAEQLTLQTTIDSSMIEIDSATASLNAEYIVENHYPLYLGLLTSFVIGFGIYLLGFYQLRMILKSAKNDFVFNPKNILRLKIIAGLIIAFKPIEWLVYRLFVVPIDEMIAVNKLSIQLDFELGSFIYGLLLFALAAVFEKGHEMYEELKLTV